MSSRHTLSGWKMHASGKLLKPMPRLYRRSEPKKKKRAKNALSFDDEEEGDDGAPDDKDAPPKKKTKAEGDEKEGNFLVRRLVKNPDVDTSFLPDVDREEREVTPGIIVTIRMTLIQ